MVARVILYHACVHVDARVHHRACGHGRVGENVLVRATSACRLVYSRVCSTSLCFVNACTYAHGIAIAIARGQVFMYVFTCALQATMFVISFVSVIVSIRRRLRRIVFIIVRVIDPSPYVPRPSPICVIIGLRSPRPNIALRTIAVFTSTASQTPA